MTARTKWVGTKLTEAEYRTLLAFGGTETLTSEWARQTLLAACRAPREEVLMAEVMALRAIVLSTLAEFKPEAVEPMQFSDKDKREKAQRALQVAT